MLLQGISRDEGRTEIFVVRDDGSTPLDADLSGVVLDDDDGAPNGLDGEVEPNTIAGLAVGESIQVEVTLTPAEDVERGSARLSLGLTSDGELVSSVRESTT